MKKLSIAVIIVQAMRPHVSVLLTLLRRISADIRWLMQQARRKLGAELLWLQGNNALR